MQQRSTDTSKLPSLALNLKSSDSSSKDDVYFALSRSTPARTLSRRSTGNTAKSVSTPSGDKSDSGVLLLLRSSTSGSTRSLLSTLSDDEKSNGITTVNKGRDTATTSRTVGMVTLGQENGIVDSNGERHHGEPRRGPMNVAAVGSNHHHHHRNNSLTTSLSGIIINGRRTEAYVLVEEFWASTDLIFQSKLTWLLLVGPVAIAGDSLGLLGEASCFALSGIALIPCAERLSWVTEQVALHTNQTIGALLNATFGNAPELLISVAALRSGFYRVVQLAMLGSMLTNMILIFGISCIIGGLRWQVQELRLTSGNVSVGMLLVATAGSLFPAILILSGQFPEVEGPTATALDPTRNSANRDRPSQEEITLSRVNASVMFILYLCYLVFQLGTHKEEFDDDHDDPNDCSQRRERAQPNVFCQSLCAQLVQWFGDGSDPIHVTERIHQPLAVTYRNALAKRKIPTVAIYETCDSRSIGSESDHAGHMESGELDVDGRVFIDEDDKVSTNKVDEESAFMDLSGRSRRRKGIGLHTIGNSPRSSPGSPRANGLAMLTIKSKNSYAAPDALHFGGGSDENDDVENSDLSHEHVHGAQAYGRGNHHQPLISMRVGIVWLFIITLCISAMSDILVGTIDGFATRMQLSQVFTSMVVIPFFSNVAEQVSAFIFAYRNEMDLCVGVTIGSAIQIATFVLPGSVLIGMFMDRSMTLYFHSYETACLFFCTVLVAAVLQGGSTNWLVGAMLVGVYIMFAAGIWFHEIENLSIDEDSATEVVSIEDNETLHM